MRLLSLLTSSLLAATVFAAKKPGDPYKDNISKSQPVALDDSSFRTLTTGSRDYTVAVLLTAMKPQYGCAMCREFAPDWDLLAKTWTKSKSKDSKMIFGTLDFVDGKQTFQAVRLLQ
jgi:oligosaccharyltransferase complex subunit gamma